MLCGRFADHEVTFSINADPLAFCAIHSRPQYAAVRSEMVQGKDYDAAVEASEKKGGIGGEEGEEGAMGWGTFLLNVSEPASE